MLNMHMIKQFSKNRKMSDFTLTEPLHAIVRIISAVPWKTITLLLISTRTIISVIIIEAFFVCKSVKIMQLSWTLTLSLDASLMTALHYSIVQLSLKLQETIEQPSAIIPLCFANTLTLSRVISIEHVAIVLLAISAMLYKMSDVSILPNSTTCLVHTNVPRLMQLVNSKTRTLIIIKR